MDQGREALAMAHNNQIVNGRGGREMEEKIEGGDNKGDINAMALAAMASAEKMHQQRWQSSDEGDHHQLCNTMVAVNGDGCNSGRCCRRRRSMYGSDGGLCRRLQ